MLISLVRLNESCTSTLSSPLSPFVRLTASTPTLVISLSCLISVTSHFAHIRRDSWGHWRRHSLLWLLFLMNSEVILLQLMALSLFELFILVPSEEPQISVLSV